MSSEATKTVVVQCPKCKASTKVSGIPESKTSIHCPKCQAQVSLHFARPLREKPAAVPTATAADYQRTLQGRSGKSRSGLYLGLGLGLLLAAGVGVGAYFYVNSGKTETAGLPHDELFGELIRVYQDGSERMNRAESARMALELDNQYLAYQNRIAELTRRLAALPAAAPRHQERIRLLQKDADFARAGYEEARRRLARLKSEADPLLAGGATAATTPTGTAPQPTVAVTPPTPPTPTAETAPAPVVASLPAYGSEKTVTLTILNFPKSRFDAAFLDRLGSWVDSSPPFIRPVWAGDLLTIEVAPVAALAKFAARVNFGRVTHLDQHQRALTVLARADDTPDPEMPTDPFQLLLRDLRGDSVEKRRAAARKLQLTKPNDYRLEVIKLLETLTQADDLETRVEVIKAYGAWAGLEGVPLLLNQLSDETPVIYRTVIAVLGAIKDPRAAEPIAQRWFVREPEAVAAALVAIGPAAEGAALGQLAQTSTPHRVAICQVLARIGTRASIGPLLKLTDEKDPMITDAAWSALEAISGRKGGTP
ncbi:MAG TPA: HEAT repeat domain-containing protein [Gemmatales bacterium]|nr:HEAT repeat domain-containing protein [Gemmatales bacterium]